MRIKKHSNRNDYLLTPSKYWVRDFTKELTPYIDINKLTTDEDHGIFIRNEVNNGKLRIPWVDSEKFLHEFCLIVSDGYGFTDKHKIIAKLPVNKVCVLAVNKALRKWMVRERSPTYYVVNNPYDECMNYLPRRLFPKCIASVRTCNRFLSSYRGIRYRYLPVPEQRYAGLKTSEIDYRIDDYRNPVCAAVALAYRFGVRKLALLCCDDSFKGERPGSIQLENGLYSYPQQLIAGELLDGMFHWMKKRDPDLEIIDCSGGRQYKNASYINLEQDLLEFFEISNGQKTTVNV